MGNQLNAQALFEWHVAQQFVSLDEQFDSFKQVVLQAIADQDNDILIKVLGNYSEPFILYGDHYEVLDFFYRIEKSITENCPEMLAVLYLIIGHCYFIQLNEELSKSYYRKATSLAFEYQLFNVLSITINNVTTLDFHKAPEELLFENSKMPAIFFLLKDTKQNENFRLRLLTLVDTAILTKRYDYAAMIYERYFKNAKVEAQSRLYYQIQLIKAELLIAEERYQDAKNIYHEMLMECRVGNQLKDLIVNCYRGLSKCYKCLNDQQLSQKFEQSQATYLQREYAHNQLLDIYFKQNTKSLNNEYSKERIQFEQLASEYLQDCSGSGYTLVIVDLKSNSTDPAFIEQVINKLEMEMIRTFSEKIVAHTRKDHKTVSYIVALPEQQFDEEVRLVFAKIRQQYPKDLSDLEAMYFASVNNKDNNLVGYEKCLELAYAYIYYELYK